MNNKELREEFLQRFFEHTFVDLKPYDNSFRDDEMIDWWLSKIDSLKSELVGRLEENKRRIDNGLINDVRSVYINIGLDEAIKIIKEI